MKVRLAFPQSFQFFSCYVLQNLCFNIVSRGPSALLTPVHSYQKAQPFQDTGHQEQPPSVLACSAESIQPVGLARSLEASFAFSAVWCMLPVSLGVHG